MSLGRLEINLLPISDERRFLWTLIFVEVQLVKHIVDNMLVLVIIGGVRILIRRLLQASLSVVLSSIERHVGVVARTLQ